MIKPQEKKLIIKAFGLRYSGAVSKLLIKAGLKNADDGNYSKASIRLFVGGKRENINVELVILKGAKAAIKRNEALNLKRKLLTKKSKD